MREGEDAGRESILLAACGAGEVLPQNPDLPADVFTACLTTPIKARTARARQPAPGFLNTSATGRVHCFLMCCPPYDSGLISCARRWQAER